MRNFLISLNLLLLFIFIGTSCTSTKTYAEMLAEEKSDIAKLIADSFKVIPFNVDSLYTPANKHIMELTGGLYVAIISKGDTSDMAVANSTRVLYRYKCCKIINDSIIFQTTSHTYPYDFIYNQAATAFNYYDGPYAVTCEGIQTPLQYVGNGAIVKLIIPSKISFSDFQSSVKPLYIKELTYTFAQH